MNPINFVDLIYNDARIRFFNFGKSDDTDSNPTWHNHISYELHFSFGATVNYNFSKHQTTLNPGEMLIIPPMIEHESVVVKSPKKDFITIVMDVKRLNESDIFYDNFVESLKENALNPIKIPEFIRENLLILDCTELYSTMLGMCRLKNAASQVVYFLFKKIMPDKPLKTERVNQRVLIDLMIFSNDVTLDKIALATNYSKRQLTRIIKEQYGMTFSQVRRRMLRNEENPKE